MTTPAKTVLRPLVSALVTTFNHERYISAAIDGLLAQTYGSMEIIVVDDGSTDGTVELVRRYESSGVRFLQTSGGGPSRAMNLAMSHARGEIFLIQSGDDLSGPTRAAHQVATLRKVEVAACLPNLIDDDGEALPDQRFSAFFRMTSPFSRARLFGSLYLDTNFLCASSVAMRRSVWETLGGFHEGLLQLQDYYYWLEVIAAGYSIAIDDARLISYRIHAHNLSDVRHDVRTQRELITLFRLLAPKLPDDLMAAVVYGDSFIGRSWPGIERKMLLALFFLRHSAEPIRQIGVDALIDLMDDPDYDDEFQVSFPLGRKTIFHALLNG